MGSQSDQSTSSGIQKWSLSRIDIRSPVAPNAWPVARVELDHPDRGRVTDVAKAPGAFDAAFAAASQIVGVAPKLLSYHVRSAPPEANQALEITVDVAIELDGRRSSGSDTGQDLVRCSLAAWLDAIAKVQAKS